jgi:hypothetical protein
MAETKIDKELLERIKKFIQKGENKYDFPTAKSFVDKAVLNMLKEKEIAKGNNEYESKNKVKGDKKKK